MAAPDPAGRSTAKIDPEGSPGEGDGKRASGPAGRGRRVASLLVGLSFCLLVAMTWATRSATGHLAFLKGDAGGGAVGVRKPIVNLNPWLTAQALTPLAVSAEEKEDAHEAEHLADHEVDQAFAAALRTAGAQKRTLTPEARELTAKVAALQETVKEDQTRLAGLLPKGAAVEAPAVGTKTSGGVPQQPGVVEAPGESDDVAVAQAQLGLDSDELNDAQQDLARAVDDDRVRIQQELTAHEAVMQKAEARMGDPGELAVIATQRHGSLASRVAAWLAQRSRSSLLAQAQQEAQSDATTLMAKHNALEQSAASADQSPAAVGASPDASTRLSLLKRQAGERQLMTIYDDRIQTEQQLAAVYAKWSAQVVVQHRIVMHLILRSLAVIALIVLLIFALDAVVRWWTERQGADLRQRQTLRTILQVTVQVAGVLAILVVVLGKPQQLTTILGLLTAGLTVALQSYILAFCGWFVLMGKNGIRVGDTVEINSVSGEVAEIGLFRTTLLETGNWTAKGHPTGRRVAFMNTFAVTGQYFNFSTAGQWMWDEITVSVPANANMYSVVETIHEAVAQETAADAARAEVEWKGASRQVGLGQFTAEPTVNLRPAAAGVDVIVRFVTRAAERVEARNKLFQAVMDAMRRPAAPGETKPL